MVDGVTRIDLPANPRETATGCAVRLPCFVAGPENRLVAIALERFSEHNIRPGRPLASIEEALVPIYLLHRFQLHAVGKLIGGEYFNYRLRGDAQADAEAVPVARQQQAIAALLGTLDPAVLELPEGLAETITPRVPYVPKTRESFRGATGIEFDPLAPANSAVALTLQVLLEPSRAARLERAGSPGFAAITDGLLDATWYADAGSDSRAAIRRQTNMQVLYGLLHLAFNEAADVDVRARALAAVSELERWLGKRAPRDASMRAHYAFAREEIRRLRNDPAVLDALVPTPVPPGSPIGSIYP